MGNRDITILQPFLAEADTILADARRLAEEKRADIVRQLMFSGAEQSELARHAREASARAGNSSLIVRASLEFTNHCRQKCSFCGMNALNRELHRYRMTYEHIAQVVDDVASLGITDLHLASGEDGGFDPEVLELVVKRAVAAGLEVTLVIGHRRLSEYEKWRMAGASRYILKVETTNETLFEAARTGTELRRRVAHLLYLRSLDYKVGTGIISGLPGQTPSDLADDLCFLTRFKPDMASVSRFLPNAESVSANESEGDPDLTLNFISLIRLEVGQSDLRIPAGTTLGHRQSDAILHGANVVSLHVTPSEYSDFYSADKIKERHLTQMDALKQLSEETDLPLRLKVHSPCRQQKDGKSSS